jgi:hypothetical protein
MEYEQKVKALIGFSIIIVIAAYMNFDATPQSFTYHAFADGERHFGIANFSNVASNIAYLIAGLAGVKLIHATIADPAKFKDPREALLFYALFVGAIVLAFGSAFYHLDPGNKTLVADRLGMIIGFMGILSVIISERVSVRWGARLFGPLLAIGALSVVYWYYSEIEGAGDLRFYGLVQFLPLVLIPTMLLAFPARYNGVKYIWWALATYALAKIFEIYDGSIWGFTDQLISGHTLKHLVSGLGIYYLVLYIKKR